jgi:hypothetical protein
MLRPAAVLVFLGVTLSSFPSGADNQVRWSVHTGGADAAVVVAVPAGLFRDVPLPVRGTRWRCSADKVLRQDPAGNTFSTLDVRCTDGETTISSSASCLIGSHESSKLAFQLVEKTTGLINGVRAECEG